MFGTPFPHAFGLDIGDFSIKLVQLRNVSFRYRRPAFYIETARSVAVPAGLITNGEVQDIEAVRGIIAKLLEGPNKKKPAKSPWVVASLPETKSFLSTITIPKSYTEILDEDVIVAAKRSIPFDEEVDYIDWQIIPSADASVQPGYTQVLVGICPKSVSDTYTFLLESLGLGVMALEIEGLSIARSMITANKVYEGEARAILDLGAARSSVIIYDQNALQLSISLPFSGELINTLLTKTHGVVYDEAEKIKREIGLRFDQKESAYWATIVQAGEQLVKQVQDAIHYYRTHRQGTNPITHITMCGGAARMAGLEEYLSTSLNIEAKQGNVLKNLTVSEKKQPLSQEDALSYATAIGLGIRAADNPFFMIDTL